MDYRIIEVKPLVNKTSWGPNDPIDFLSNIPLGFKMVPGTQLLKGNALVQPSTGAFVTPITQVFLDPKVGHHSYFDNIITKFSGSIVEDFQAYPRYIKMKADATMYHESLGTESGLSMQGRTPNERVMQGYLQGRSTTGVGDHTVPFCLPLDIASNKLNAAVAADQVGTITNRFTCAPSVHVMYGEGVTTTCTFLLTDLTLLFQIKPDDGTRDPIQYEYYNQITKTIQTDVVTIAANVEAQANAVHMSFISEADENTVTKNYLATGAPPGYTNPADTDLVTPNYGFQSIQFSINDNDTELVSYVVRTPDEIKRLYLASFTPQYRAWNTDLFNGPFQSGYGVGLGFGGFLSLGVSTFSCQMTSKIDNTNPYKCYMYFRCLGTL